MAERTVGRPIESDVRSGAAAQRGRRL